MYGYLANSHIESSLLISLKRIQIGTKGGEGKLFSEI